MATYSTYKNLEKPLSTERYNVGVANGNMDIIDSELHKLDLKNESQDSLLATKDALNTEVSRASAKENAIVQDLDTEISRAKELENELLDNIINETKRASLSESNIQESLFMHISDGLNPHKVTPEQLHLENVNNTADIDKPVSISQQNAINDVLYQSNNYTDAKIAELIDGAPETLNTLKEVADAIQTHNSVAEALNAAIGNKADAAEANAHINNNHIHVTASEKEKLKGIETGAQVNTVTSVNGQTGDVSIITHSENQALPTVITGDADTMPELNRLSVTEYSPTSKNIPGAHWYHIFSGTGSDGNYGTQLAVGMTTADLALRNKQNGKWGEWNHTATKTELENINPLNAFYNGASNHLDTFLCDIDFIKQHPYLFGHSDALTSLGYWINIFSIKNAHYNQVSQIAVGEEGMASRYYRHNTGTWSDWYFTATKNDINTFGVTYSNSEPTSLSTGMTWIGN